MVVVGFAVTVAPVVALSPVAGVQAYVLAPLAVSEVEEPLQIVVVPDTDTVGNGFTVIVTVVLFVQPAEEVPVTE